MFITLYLFDIHGKSMEDMKQNMDKKAVYVKKGSELKQAIAPGKLYKLMIKSSVMEAIISELEPNAESRWYQHEGEELHYMIKGEMDYIIDERTYHLKEGDLLWHVSTVKHRAKNTTEKTISYITIGSPPTFM